MLFESGFQKLGVKIFIYVLQIKKYVLIYVFVYVQIFCFLLFFTFNQNT